MEIKREINSTTSQIQLSFYMYFSIRASPLLRRPLADRNNVTGGCYDAVILTNLRSPSLMQSATPYPVLCILSVSFPSLLHLFIIYPSFPLCLILFSFCFYSCVVLLWKILMKFTDKRKKTRERKKKKSVYCIFILSVLAPAIKMVLKRRN